MNEFLRIFLPIYYAIFFFAVFLLRTVIVWKRTGVNAYVLLKQGGTYGVIGVYFKLLPLASFFAVATYSFFPSIYDFLAPFHWLENQFNGTPTKYDKTCVMVRRVWPELISQWAAPRPPRYTESSTLW